MKSYVYSYAGLLIATAIWFIIGNWLAGILCLFLFLLYRLSKQRLLAEFSTDKIKYTSILLKAIEWNQLNNAILKDGILTIDFKNNKIIQAEIDDSANNINEKEFNDFCSQQLKEKNQQK